MLALALALAAHAAPVLTVTGDCPGLVDVAVTGVTPGANLAFFSGLDAGSDVVGRGPCAGAVSGLAGLRYRVTMPDDGDGSFAFSPSLGDAMCSRHVQVLDMTTCEFSDAVDLAGPGGGGFDLVAGKILLSGGHFIKCFSGLTVTDDAVTCDSPLFDQEDYSLDRAANTMLGLHNSGEEYAEGHEWLLTYVGAELGYAGSRSVVMNAGGPDSMWGCQGDGATNNEYCYYDGALHLWMDDPICNGGWFGGCNVMSNFTLFR